VYKSTNLGETWEQHYTGTGSSLLSVFFNDANTGWICGTGGAIIQTTDGGGVFIRNISGEIPDRFTLEQNYPNPFNPVTKIKFDVAENGKWKSENGMVTMKVYDILGKEVATLVNENLRPGTYEAIFNAGLLPSGIYFYRLETEKNSYTKKMILLK